MTLDDGQPGVGGMIFCEDQPGSIIFCEDELGLAEPLST
jgi:hypothetical protein